MFLVMFCHSLGLAVLQDCLADSADRLAVTGNAPTEERAVVTQMTGDSLLTQLQLQLFINRADLTPESVSIEAVLVSQLPPSQLSALTCI